MYQAELRGKLSSELTRSEDILTSNVFSFFKYSDRTIYLRPFLEEVGIKPTDHELREAEFRFWPVYDDDTEPDVVIIVGNYYILLEVKYYSGFGRATKTRKSQLLREIEGGRAKAETLGKKFLLVAITADYCYRHSKFVEILEEEDLEFQWVNWQTVTTVIEHHLEESQGLASHELAQDLHQLLLRKGLRPFASFDAMAAPVELGSPETIFFNADTADFRGDFIGFIPSLSRLTLVPKRTEHLFFERTYFSEVDFVIHEPATCVFSERGVDSE